MATVFINEIHYDNDGTDTGEAIEIAGPAGTDLTGWDVVLYNGNGGAVYDSDPLTGIIPDQQNGFGTVAITYPSNGIQNGSPDGIALVDNNDSVVQFLSYEGSFTGVGGPAGGTTSMDIGVAEGSSTPAGFSLQLTGTGSDSEDFTWSAPSDDSFGAVNQGQTFDTNGGGDGGGEEPPPADITPIYEIQGAAQTSPLVGDSVTTSGIVTAVDSNGFYLQDSMGDGDIATSDAIFVFTSSTPDVSTGDELQVEGTVSEFTPGGASTGNLSTTQISGSPTITTVSTGNTLPAAVIIGEGGRVPPSENIDDDAFGSFDRTTDGIDFFESLEATRVTAQDLVAVAGTNDFGEIFGVVDNGASATGLSDRGTLNISPDDFNPERIQIDEDTGILPGFELPLVDTGASLGDVTGVISYDFGNFQIQPTETFTATNSDLQPETSPLTPTADQLAVASYNVLNLDPNDADGDTDIADGRFSAIAQDIANNLNSPDIIGLQEIQDNDGSVNSDVTAANVTLQNLVDAIATAGGPTYEFIDNPFIGDDTNGGQPGGNIRTAFLYNPQRVDLVEGSVQTVTDPQEQQTNPDNPFFDSRLPLAANFQFNGQTVTVVDNHFSSKGGSAPILGVEQPFEDRQEDPTVNGSLEQRRAQAEAVNNFVEGILTDNPDANVVVEGDLNEFEFVSPLEILEQNLTNLTETLPADERYTFIFQGNSQALDHILVSDNLAAGAEFDEVHVNSEFAETDQRASDHDPILAQLTLEGPEGIVLEGGNGKDTLEGSAGDDRLSGGNGKDTLFGLAGDDFLAGDNGSDTLTGGPGDDTLTGGNGGDTFVLAAGEGTDTVTDFQNGPDRIGLAGDLTFDQLSIAQGTGTNAGNTLISITSSNELLASLTGVQSGMLVSGDFVTV